MLFITSREPKGSIRSKKGRAFKFDLNKNAPSNSVYYCERTDKGGCTEIGADALMDKLKNSNAKQLLIYIHGFDNLPDDDVFPRVKLLQKFFDEKEKNLVEVVPLIWPCDNDFGIVKDYWDDQKAADASNLAFSRVLQKFLSWREGHPADNPCLKRINVLAHSMGNRVFRGSLEAWDKYDLADGVPLIFRNSFLVAADIVNESLEEGQAGRLISESARNVVVYHASDDLALRASKVSNLKNKVASRRLGHSGPEDMKKVQSNVYAIDCDNFNNKYDWPKGHSYFIDDGDGKKPGKVFEHIFNTIKTGRVDVKGNADRKLEL